MILFLNLPFILISLLLFAGRIYELNITDFATGYIRGNAVVSKPFMIGIIFLIALCCSIVVYPRGRETSRKYKGQYVGPFGIIAGAFFIGGAVARMMYTFKWGGFLGFDIAAVLGSAGLIAFSFLNIRGEKKEAAPFVTVLLLFASFCLDSALYNVSTVHNTIYTIKNIAFVVCFIFVVLLFKSVYAQSKYTQTILYMFAILNFAFSFAAMLALVIMYVKNVGFVAREILPDIGYIVMGAYSMFTALAMTSRGKNGTVKIKRETTRPAKKSEKITEKKKPAKKAKEEFPEVEDTAVIPSIKDTKVTFDTAETFSVSRATVNTIMDDKAKEDKQAEIVKMFSSNFEEEPEKQKKAVEKQSRKVSEPITSERKVFRGDGSRKKDTSKKVVWKAPK